jgi:hypothetical protein
MGDFVAEFKPLRLIYLQRHHYAALVAGKVIIKKK